MKKSLGLLLKLKKEYRFASEIEKYMEYQIEVNKEKAFQNTKEKYKRYKSDKRFLDKGVNSFMLRIMIILFITLIIIIVSCFRVYNNINYSNLIKNYITLFFIFYSIIMIIIFINCLYKRKVINYYYNKVEKLNKKYKEQEYILNEYIGKIKLLEMKMNNFRNSKYLTKEEIKLFDFIYRYGSEDQNNQGLFNTAEKFNKMKMLNNYWKEKTGYDLNTNCLSYIFEKFSLLECEKILNIRYNNLNKEYEKIK